MSKRVLIAEDRAVVALELETCRLREGYDLVGVPSHDEGAVQLAQSLESDSLRELVQKTMGNEQPIRRN